MQQKRPNSDGKKHVVVANVDAYVTSLSKGQKEIAKKVKQEIITIAKGCEETIGYGMPAYKLNGRYLVFFALFKNHLGFYPTPAGVSAFEKQLKKYKYAKGSIQFPLNEPIPYVLIRKIVKFRVKQEGKKKND